MPHKKPLPPPKDKGFAKQRFKPIPKKVIERKIEVVIHFGNVVSGPLCKANDKDAKLALQGFTCGKCLDVWEEIMFDRLYGTNSEEDATCP